jgi:hypothetical protein
MPKILKIKLKIMHDIDLRPYLKNKMKTRPRVRGRYNSSELYAITHGWVTPEQWINPTDKLMADIMRMWSGIGIHNQLEDLLGTEYSEKKKEFVYKDIVLVGKVDYMPPQFPDHIWEFKTSEKLMEKMKPWAEHQVKLYCTMFDKSKGSVFQPVKNSEGMYLKCLGTVDRDDNWFEEEMKKLYEFHLKVVSLYEKM